jgi:MFS transporter, PPP family, 3-phenylpropionic acid transporter
MKRELLRLNAAYLFLFASLAVVAPYFPLYLAARGFSPVHVGFLFGSFSAAGVFGPLFIGGLADTTRKYRTLLFGVILLACAAFMGMQTTALLLPALLLAIIFGFTFRSGMPLLDTLATRVMVNPEENYGKVRIWGSLGFIICSLTLQFGNLIDGSSSSSILLAFIVTLIPALIAFLFLPVASSHPPSHPSRQDTITQKKRGAFEGLRNRRFWLATIVVFLGFLGMTSHYSFFSLYLQEGLGISRVSIFWAVGVFAELPMIFFSGKVIRRIGVFNSLVLAFGAITIRLLIYALVPSVPPLLLAQLLHAFTFGLLHTATMAFINRTVPPKSRATAIAVLTSVTRGSASFLGSAAGGLIIQKAGYVPLFSLYALFPALSLLILFINRRRFTSPRA